MTLLNSVIGNLFLIIFVERCAIKAVLFIISMCSFLMNT